MKNCRMFPKRLYLNFAKEHRFTRREAEIGFLLANGFSNARISDELHIAIMTVKKHITHIYEKSGIYCRKDFILYFSNLPDIGDKYNES